ncbi:ATP-binding cassette domain-containing protein [Agrococcus sp. SL85]|uniref:ABC transporter ATP-binding protein n=1 Tax=Agrococcus sp. SL85 TaxID=2995141 RepID=UPI00226CE95F|nr:ATP-binding cassette domain-containing protein [Agrococcus sp. SL85]WAC67192.1 ATP-binding cassette domain-containing protein [Agrococcus sp. SL85]
MLSLHAISRSFGGHLALSDVGFDVKDGLMTGFVGANGAGKTTTMRIILGVLAADGGEVRWDGRPITADDRAQFGYMPEERGLYPKMRVKEQLVYLARLHGMDARTAAGRADDLLERLGLGPRRDDTLESLSLGNQQRAQIAAALVHDPAALVLDEPFSGLDPMAVEVTLEVLRDVARSGAPVLFSSHQLDVVERLCDELVILAEGRVRAAGTRQQLRERHSAPEWVLETDDGGFVRGIPGVEVVEFDGGHVRFTADDPSRADAVLREAIERGRVRSFAPSIRPLTEIFQEVVR